MQTKSTQSRLWARSLRATVRIRAPVKHCRVHSSRTAAALSTTQQVLQEQIRKAQVASDVLQLLAEKQPLVDSVLASTAIQKLAYLSWPDYEKPRLETTVTELAHVASSELTALSNPTDMLAGFAELQIKSRATDQLLEAFVLHYDMSHQPSSGKDAAPKQWDTVSWGWADNSNEACKDLVTVAWAFGRLMQECNSRPLQFVDDIAAELSKKLHNNLLRDAFTPDDLADVVDAFANVHEMCLNSGNNVNPR